MKMLQEKKIQMKPLGSMDAKLLNKTLANQIQQLTKIICTMTKWDLFQLQSWFNIQKSINIIHCINKVKKKNH